MSDLTLEQADAWAKWRWGEYARAFMQNGVWIAHGAAQDDRWQRMRRADQAMKPRLVADCPPCPPITPEVRERILSEAREVRADMRQRIAACERLTPEDWASLVC